MALQQRTAFARRRRNGQREDFPFTTDSSEGRFFRLVMDLTEAEEAGGSYAYGIEYSKDGGVTWHILVRTDCGVDRKPQRGGYKAPELWYRGRVIERRQDNTLEPIQYRAFYESDRPRTLQIDVTDDDLVLPARQNPRSVAFDAVTESYSASSGNLSFSHTVTDNNPGIAVSFGNYQGDYAGATASYGGTGLTNRAGDESADSDVCAIFADESPATGANTVVIAAGGTNTGAAAISVVGVDQTTPVTDASATTGADTTASITLTTANGEMLVDVLAYYAVTSSAGADQTERWNQHENDSGSEGSVGSTQAGDDGGVMSWSLGNTINWALAAVSFAAASAASPAGTFHMPSLFAVG